MCPRGGFGSPPAENGARWPLPSSVAHSPRPDEPQHDRRPGRAPRPANVLVEREDLIPYSFDATAALRKVPEVVVFPRRPRQRCCGPQALAEAQGSGRRPGKWHGPKRRQRPGRGVGRRVPCQDGPYPGVRCAQLHAPRRGRGAHADDLRRGGSSGALLSARPGLDEDLHDRGQRRGKLRRDCAASSTG